MADEQPTDERPSINFRVIFEQQSALWLKSPVLSKDVLEVKLEGVEEGGIWVQHQSVTNVMLQALDKPSLEGEFVVFVPYSAIQFAFVIAEGVSLSTKKLGL
jgi:hypothetical protein